MVAVRVTVWGVSQLALVNVRYSELTVNCVGAEFVTERVTLAVGWVSRTTVKESAVPASVGDATVFDTVTPADWAIATRECELISVARTMKRMANLLAEARHEVPVLAISDNQTLGKQKPSERYRNQDPRRWVRIAAQTATSDLAAGAMACSPSTRTTLR